MHKVRGQALAKTISANLGPKAVHHLAKLYGAEASADLISRASDAVLDEVQEWRSRPPEAVKAAYDT